MATKTSPKNHSGVREKKIYGLIYSEDSEEVGGAASRADVEEKAASAEHAPVTDSPSAGEKQVERSEAKPAQSRSAKKYKLCISVDNDIEEMLFVFRTLYPRKYRELTKKLRAIVRETIEEAYKHDKRMQAILKLK